MTECSGPGAMIGCSYFSRNFAYVPSSPGMRKSKMLHSSLNRFSIGVPVNAKRWSAGTRLTAFASFVAWFLMYWASSRAIIAKWQAA